MGLKLKQLKNKELIPKLPEEQRNKLKETILHLKKLNEEKEWVRKKLTDEPISDFLFKPVTKHFPAFPFHFPGYQNLHKRSGHRHYLPALP